MSEKKVIASEGTGTFIEKVLGPITNIEDAAEMLKGKLGQYPLYAFFLYSEVDTDMVEFIRLKGQWLHSLSGADCLIGILENPGEWGEGWERYWREKLGSSFSQVSGEWMKLKPFDINTAFSLADFLGVEKNTFPCLVFVESFSEKEFLCIPIVSDKKDYIKYFQDIFTAVNASAKASSGERLLTLRNEWKRVWAKWILPEKIKNMAKDIQEWGSILKETKDAIVSAIEPLTPMLQSLKTLFSGTV